MGKFKVGDRVRLKGRNIEGVVLYNADISTILTKFIGDGYSEYCLYRPEELELIARDRPKADTRVIINPPAVILFRDDKKYVAKAQDEPFDAERGLMVALLKSFGIGYSDIQKMLKGAKRQKKSDNVETIITHPLTSNFWGNYIDGLSEITEKELKVINECLKNNESANPKPKRGRPRKFRVGDIVAIKDLDTYKYAFIFDKESLLISTYKIDRIDSKRNVHIFAGWFAPNELELIEKASDKDKKIIKRSE